MRGYTLGMSSAVFNHLYKQLNPKQREAVDALDGPTLVLAGPGTGKTSILTLRVANILRRTDTPPDAILALTFTEAGVKAMRRKLVSILGPRSYEVQIHTFHSFCNDLIKRFPERFSRIIGSEHMEELEQFRIMRTIVDRLKPLRLRPKNNPLYYVPHAIDALRNLKRENIGVRAFADFLARSPERKSDKWQRSRELARVYRAYERELQRRRLYDFEDMVMEVIRELEKSAELKLRLQEEHQYILADEHQDANNAQNRLLELLSDYDDTPNLFIVGDDKQAIFRFQGASLENFHYFRKRFPRARIIALEENYRSQPTLLQAAHSVIVKNAASKGTPPLRPRAAHPPRAIRIVEARDVRSELSYLTEEIARRLARGDAASELVILVRDNKDAEMAAAALRNDGIAVSSYADANILEHPRIDALRKLFAAVTDPASDVHLAPVLFLDFLGIPPLSALDAVHNRKKSVLHSIGGPALLKFRNLLLSWHRLAKNEGLVEAFERIAEESGFLRDTLARPDAAELLTRYDAFLEAAKRLSERDRRAKLQDFLERIAAAEDFRSGIFAAEAAPAGAVQVMTAHKAKGLEFDVVFILFARDGKWGGRRSRELFSLPVTRGTSEMHGASPEDDEDERRLFYVALTRARKEAIVLFESTGEDGRDRLPSRFISEIDERFRSPLSFSRANEPPHARFKRIPRPRLLRDKNYLNALFVERGLSVTHINNFLECPWKYFFLNLIRLPRAQSNAELYGSAMHAALALHFNGLAREEDRAVSATLAFFEHCLRRTHLAAADFTSCVVSGRRELKGYLGRYVFSRNIWNEFAVGGVPITVGGKTIELGGKLDKVELLSGSAVNVVDYKTGAPKTRNEILGKTQNANGNYYRQLVFYKLLLDSGKKWRMKTGTLDFLKPTPGGSYRREAFEIEEKEAADLRALVADISAQILSLSFPGKGCGEKECEYCRLSKALR